MVITREGRRRVQRYFLAFSSRTEVSRTLSNGVYYTKPRFAPGGYQFSFKERTKAWVQYWHADRRLEYYDHREKSKNGGKPLTGKKLRHSQRLFVRTMVLHESITEMFRPFYDELDARE